MYGLVNKAIQDMVCNRFGEKMWKDIKRKALVEEDVFISMESYPDDMTHRLIKATSIILGLSSSKIMQLFGEYWVQYTAKEGYGELMDMGGDTLPEFLENLNNLHAHVGVNFPKLEPPSFECTHVEEDALVLHYHSTREGLSPMIIGLVKGLGKRFNTEVDVIQIQNRNKNSDYDEFLVKYKPN